MKKLLLTLTCLMLFAAAAVASPVSGTEQNGGGHLFRDGGYDHNPNGRPSHSNDTDDGPVRPVPEPGTMALASMGLIALGAAARKRRK